MSGRTVIALSFLAVVGCGGGGSSEPGARSETTQTSVPASVASSSVETTTSAPEDAAPDLPATLDERLADFLGDDDGGVAVLVVRDGTTVTNAAGAATAAGDPVTPGTAFRVGSISKPFVATMVMQLVDEGRIELDDPFSTHLPDTPIGGDVTVRQLLSHRSGIPNYTETEFMADLLAHRSRRFTPADILGAVAAIEPEQPDSRFAYSNTNYILLGQLVERLDGTDLNTSLRQRITERLELTATRFATADDPTPAGLAAGFSSVLRGQDDDKYTSIASGAWAAGALVSTVAELHTFLEALFAGELVSQDALAEMTDTGPGDYGYGLGLAKVGLGPGRFGFGHSGGIFGYTSAMGIDPTTGDTIVVLTNNDELIADQLAAVIVGDW
jgi:D-alanyl-D-alanine carboxypeptidase